MIHELPAIERFSKGVSQLVIGVDMGDSQLLTSHLISNKEKIDSHVFHATVENRIRTDVSSTDIVTVDDRGFRNLDSKLRDEITEPV